MRRTPAPVLRSVATNSGQWRETPTECRAHVEKYLSIMLPDPSMVVITDCHRLGSTKPASGDFTAKGVQKARPIIFKVKDYFQVRAIRENLDKLKAHFNENPSEKSQTAKNYLI